MLLPLDIQLCLVEGGLADAQILCKLCWFSLFGYNIKALTEFEEHREYVERHVIMIMKRMNEWTLMRLPACTGRARRAEWGHKSFEIHKGQ